MALERPCTERERATVSATLREGLHDGEVPSPASRRPGWGGSEALAAAALLRRILVAVEEGELEAKGPRAMALLRRVEGAAAALEATAADARDH